MMRRGQQFKVIFVVSLTYLTLLHTFQASLRVDTLWDDHALQMSSQPKQEEQLDEENTYLDAKDYNNSFSACLMWMDDNFRLPEWIAYHYYMTNLRYLVVAVDENSKTSPTPVLERWKSRMTIVVWTHNANFTSKKLTILPTQSHNKRANLLVRRQGLFYQACAVHLKAENRTWTSFHDNDEYLVVTKQANVSHEEIRQEPGVVLKIVQQYSSVSEYANNMTVHNAGQFQNWKFWFSALPCLTIPRLLFSAVPSLEEEVSRDVPSFVDAFQFDTLRYHYQATRIGDNDGLAKALIDVSRLPDNAVKLSGGEDPHRPFRNSSICTHAYPSTNVLPLVIHHYLGSWEAFSYRDDSRKGGVRSFEKWQKRSSVRRGGFNDDARPWISGFVKMVGEQAAKELLRDAGLPRNYTKTENETAEWATVVPR